MSQYLLTVSEGEEAFVRKLLRKLPGVQVEKVKPKPSPPKSRSPRSSRNGWMI